MSKRRALKFSGVSVVENIVGFVVVFFTKNTQLKMTKAHLKLSSPVLLDKNFCPKIYFYKVVDFLKPGFFLKNQLLY